jgi:hypothetical protein
MPISLQDPVRLVFPPRTSIVPSAPLDQAPLGSTGAEDTAPQQTRRPT